MARTKTVYRCSDCGAEAPQWTGWCSGCQATGTLVESQVTAAPRVLASLAPAAPAIPIAEASTGGVAPRPTNIAEADRVLGGGLVAGSVSLLGGEPGVGKSTFLLHLASAVASDGRRCLYVTAEESAQQVAARAERIGAMAGNLWLAAETVLPNILSLLDEVRPELLVVDSIQTLVDPELGAAAGSLTQVRGCAQTLVAEAKRRDLTVVMVGHVTKDGGLAGPKVLEHVVDTVLSFEGERHHALRLLRATKHRFGGTHELGLFEMGDCGLMGVPDPSALFLTDRQVGIPGSVVAPVLDGQRPMLVELQALVVPTQAPMPRRTAQGVDSGRLAQVLAVLERRIGLFVSKHDVHVAVSGGVRVREPGADLAIALAVASALTDRPLPPQMVACGEVGLCGGLRQVQGTDRRLAEAARLGFTSALAPASAPDPPAGLRVGRFRALHEAVTATRLVNGS
ncbi:MAG TPA: DNA repair protein RadA [Acidimicrobiales bacterium]|nr:DNA repair protein RadA [Acidimicrobiales bacterium]